MQEMNDTRAELNLIVVFDAIARHGSITRAAEALNLSQPAVSHALRRLRDVTGDPLFRRIGGRMQPTPHAAAMAEGAQRLVAEARGLLRPEGFDPSASRRAFRVAASDYSLLVLLPALMAQLRAEAPGVRLILRPVGPRTPADLAEGRLDASFWGGKAPGGRFRLTPLFEERLVGVCAADHPFAGAAPNLADWLAMPQAVVSLGDPGENPVQRALGATPREVALVSPSFMGAMVTVASGGLVMALPRRLLPIADGLGLRCFVLPVQPDPYGYGILARDEARGDAGLSWLIGRIQAHTPS